MYKNNRNDYIYELQRYLSLIGEAQLLLNGRFDSATAKATKKFKSSKGLGDDVIVDKAVFDEIYNEYRKKIFLKYARSSYTDESSAKYINEEDVNKMLITVLRGYGRHTDLRVLPYSYPETNKALEEFMGICGLNSLKITKEEILHRLIMEYNAQNKLDTSW